MARARPSAALTANSVSVRYCSISSVFMCSPESHCGQEPPLSFAALCGVAHATAFAWNCRGLRAFAQGTGLNCRCTRASALASRAPPRIAALGQAGGLPERQSRRLERRLVPRQRRAPACVRC
jgi:hypothetical protein